MVTRQFWDVHTAPVNHLSTAEAMAEVKRTDGARKIISDRCAQTIAAWWHSAAMPYSTRLSTGGHVDRYATIDDFCPPNEWDALCETEDDKRALRRLRDYLRHYQATAPSAVRPCACHDCFETAVGTAGQLCHQCEQEGCDAQFNVSCEWASYEQEEPPCEGCDDCIFCVPGA